MEQFTSFFELHVGFPTGDSSQAAIAGFLAKLQDKNSPDWSRSVVHSVSAHLSQAGCLDPHNVPGTLGWLVSRKIFREDRTWDTTKERAVRPACDQALEQLSRLGIDDARLEIEFPFACYAATVEAGKLCRSSWAEDPISMKADHLSFPFGILLEDVPQWEIHFLLERIPDSTSPEIPVEEVAEFLSPYGLDVEQTIEYRSAAMIESGRTDYRLIATAYFPDAATTVKEAERVFHKESLCQDAFARGYTVRLILEHIVACVRPITSQKLTVGSVPVEVPCAR